MPRYDFDNKVVFITGAARGVGRKIAEMYAEQGADIVVTDICENIPALQYELGTETDLEETADRVRKTGSQVIKKSVDVRDPESVRRGVEEAIEEFGQIDILAANAGVWDSQSFQDIDDSAFDALIETNLKGAWLTSKYVAKQAIRQEIGASIVITASTAGLVGTAGSVHYAASKHGAVGLTKSLAMELGPYDIRVNAVSPTGVDSPLVEKVFDNLGSKPFDRISDPSGTMNLLDGNLIEPRDVAEAHLWLGSAAARYVTGSVIPVDAGMTSK